MMSIYVIKNKVENGYSPLEISPNDIVAKRRFKDALSSDKVVYKDDFELYCLGDINPENMEITPKKPLLVATWADLESLDAK